jgi:WD40 repeat protein
MEDGEALVYANLAGDLLVCDSASPKSTRREIGKSLSVILSDDRGQLASIDPDGHLLLGGKENPLKPEPVVKIPQLSNGCPTPLAFSPDGSLLACIEDGNERAFILDVAAREPLIHLPESKSGWTSVAFRHDGKLVALGNKDGQIILCDPTTGTIVRHVAAQFPVRDIAFRPGSDDLAAIGSVDRFVEIWDSSKGESRLVISGHRTQTDDLVFTPDGKRLFTAGPGKTVTVWDADSGDELLVLDDAHGLPRGLAVSGDNRKLAASVGLLPTAGKIVIWDGSTGRPTE